MKAVVVYESMWGNTARVARAVAKGLGDVPLLDVASTSVTDLQAMDLIVIGGPTHAFSMSRVASRDDAHRQGAREGAADRGIRDLLWELPAPMSALVATFDTRVTTVRRLPGSAAKAAANDLRRHHAAQVLDVQSFYVEGVQGPLVPGELARASAWGAELAVRAGDASRGPEVRA